jgi:hypothetical protein
MRILNQMLYTANGGIINDASKEELAIEEATKASHLETEKKKVNTRLIRSQH